MSWGWVGHTWPMAGDELVRYWRPGGWVGYSCWRAGDELVYPGVNWGWVGMGDELVGGMSWLPFPICIWCVIYLMCSPEPAQTARRRFPHLVYTNMEWIKNELRKSSIFDWVSAANRHLLTEIGPEAMVGSIDLSNIRQQQWLPSP